MEKEKNRVENLPNINDYDFVRMFHEIFPDLSDEIVIRERRILANYLRFKSIKLSPFQTLNEISNYFDAAEYSLTIGDLELSISELFQDADMEKTYHLDLTIGELIYDISIAKKKLGKRGDWFC